MDRTAWNERYGSTELVWSEGPNAFLPTEVAGLAPGRALDLACGEGRNALWLAEQGWDVTGVDFSEAGVDKGRRFGDERGITVDWQVADITVWRPGAPFDLVVIFYLQLPAEEMATVLAMAAEAVAPGGTFLLVAHDRSNLESGYGGPGDISVLPTPQSVVAAINGLEVETALVVERPVDTAEGERIALDTFVRAHRPA
ncbi:MAG: class I SAM-dependent methyltransferase [Acidimicrobiales bacterium]